ncbi:MAG: anion transporter [Candidatus Xenobia bacterium]
MNIQGVQCGGMLLQSLGIAVVVAVYLGIGFGRLPWTRLDRAGIALVGAALLLPLRVLTLQQACQAVDGGTLVFLLGMMLLVAHLELSGFFAVSTATLARRTHGRMQLLVAITVASGVLSALIMNDAVVLMMTPIVLSLTDRLGVKPVPYLLALAGASNLGSAATLNGNPQNVLIASYSHLPWLTFTRNLLPVALIGLAVQILLLYLLYPEVRSTAPSLPRLEAAEPANGRLLVQSTTVGALLLFGFLIGLPVAETALVAGSALLLLARQPPRVVNGLVDWGLLVMFSGMFAVTEAVQRLGLLAPFESMHFTPWTLTGVTGLLSNLVSNVPAVLLLHRLLPHATAATWMLVSAASTLAGNLTLLGSVANLIVAESVARRGVHLSFWEHLRFGLPLTLITLAVAVYSLGGV